MLQSPPAGLSCLGPVFRKAFRSLTAAPRFQVTAARSKLPACFFNAALKNSSNPFDPLLLRSLRPSGLGGIIAMNPLSDFFSRARAEPEPPLPSGDFYIPLRIAAFDSEFHSKVHLRDLPDSPSLPAGFMLLTISHRIIVPGSLRLTKFDCSVNLLEP